MALEPFWPVPQGHPQVDALAESLGVSPLCATLLLNRGLHDREAARRFLVPRDEIRLPPLADADWVVERLRLALERGERVAVWGDYDVDGLTGSALLLDCFGRRGLLTAGYNPHRLNEGYGLNVAGLATLKAQGVGLVFTVDCGISNVAEIDAANAMGLEVVVTDHHDIPRTLPPAARLLNHKLGDDTLLKQLAGVGVAYQLACDLIERWPAGDSPEDYLDLLAVGTIADVAPLRGYNRDLVRRGLWALHTTTRPGLAALLAVAKLEDRVPTAVDVAFKLGPRLNAVGRMAHPDLALKLLLSTDRAEADVMAAEIDGLNVERQALVARIQAEAEAMVADEVDLDRDPVIVLAKAGWHHGVIGIVCSRLVEQFGRPVFLGCHDEGQIRGSARSPGNLSISAALQATSAHLAKFGGHAPAGGFSLAAERWANWQQAVLAYAGEYLEAGDLRPVLPIEAAPPLVEVTLATYEEIAGLAPFGAANPEPLLAAFGARVLDQKAFGKDGSHRRAFVETGDEPLEVILWRAGETPLPERIDLAYRIEYHEWRGRSSLRLNAQAWRPHQPDALAAVPGAIALPARLFAVQDGHLAGDDVPAISPAPAPVSAGAVVPAAVATIQRRSEGELPWRLSEVLAAPPAWGRLLTADGREEPLPIGREVAMADMPELLDCRGRAGIEADPALHGIISYRNDCVRRPGAATVVGESLALMGLPEDGGALRAVVCALGSRRLLLCYDEAAEPVTLSAGWLHALASLLDAEDPYQAAWEQMRSTPGLVGWGLRLLAELGVVVETDGVTRRGLGRTSRLLRELENYTGYRRWDERRRQFWRVMTDGSPAEIMQLVGERSADGN